MNQSRLFTLRMNNKLPVILVIILCITEVAINIKDKKSSQCQITPIVPHCLLVTDYCDYVTFPMLLLLSWFKLWKKQNSNTVCLLLIQNPVLWTTYRWTWSLTSNVTYTLWYSDSGKFRCRMNAVHSLTSCKMLSGTFWHSESVLGLQQHLGGCYLTK